MIKGEVEIKGMDYNGPCVYICKNLNNGKLYLGSTNTYRKRMNEHRNDLLTNIHCNRYLQRALNKGQNFTFEVLEITSISDLLLKEDYYCCLYNTYNRKYGYNLLKPGECPKFRMTEGHKRKMKQGRKKRGWDCTHLRTPEVLRKSAIAKHKKVNIFLKDGTFFKIANSLIEAEEITKVPRQNIGQCCRGAFNRVNKGYYFRFYNDFENSKLFYKCQVFIDEKLYETKSVPQMEKILNMTRYQIYKYNKIGSFEGKPFRYLNRKN